MTAGHKWTDSESLLAMQLAETVRPKAAAAMQFTLLTGVTITKDAFHGHVRRCLMESDKHEVEAV